MSASAWQTDSLMKFRDFWPRSLQSNTSSRSRVRKDLDVAGPLPPSPTSKRSSQVTT